MNTAVSPTIVTTTTTPRPQRFAIFAFAQSHTQLPIYPTGVRTLYKKKKLHCIIIIIVYVQQSVDCNTLATSP